MKEVKSPKKPLIYYYGIVLLIILTLKNFFQNFLIVYIVCIVTKIIQYHFFIK